MPNDGAANASARQTMPNPPTQVWAADFQLDATTDGLPVEIVSIVDEHTRECLGGLVDRSITGDRTTNPIESTFGSIRSRSKIANGPGSLCRGNCHGLQADRSRASRWRAVNAPQLVTLVRRGATFENGNSSNAPTKRTERRPRKDLDPQTSDSANCQAAAGFGDAQGCPKALVGSKVWRVCRQW